MQHIESLEKKIIRILLLDNSKKAIAGIAGYKREVDYAGEDSSDGAHRFNWHPPLMDFKTDAYALPGHVYLEKAKEILERLF